MSMDFFDRLAAAAVEPGESIRPRAMSRFEPLADNPAGVAAELPEDPAENRPAIAEPHASAPHPSILPPDDEPIGKQEKIAAPGSSRPPERNESQPLTPIDPMADGSPPQPRPARRIDETVLPKPGGSDPPATISSAPDISPTARQRSQPPQPGDTRHLPLRTIRPAVEPPPPGENVAGKSFVNVETERPSAENAVAGMAEPTARPTPPHGDTVPPPPAVIRPRRTLAAGRDRGVEAPRRPDEDQPTTIEISIGNIELRPQPTASAAAQSARPPFQPTLSLDDYLARRQGGER